MRSTHIGLRSLMAAAFLASASSASSGIAGVGGGLTGVPMPPTMQPLSAPSGMGRNRSRGIGTKANARAAAKARSVRRNRAAHR